MNLLPLVVFKQWFLRPDVHGHLRPIGPGIVGNSGQGDSFAFGIQSGGLNDRDTVQQIGSVLEAQLGIDWQFDFKQIDPRIVDLLEGIDDRSAHEGDPATVFFELGMGMDAANRHG
ncbi:hypothetical protein MLD59_22630, partial [Verrucomicrobiaceae bacterium E54]|nr:hypothetical protein [Verrucomicrobiaceae bacterium E54]